MNKYLILLCLFLLLPLATATPPLPSTPINENVVQITKGWNLILNVAEYNQYPGATNANPIADADILAKHQYIPMLNKYMKTKPELSNAEQQKIVQELQNTGYSTASATEILDYASVWVYSRKAGTYYVNYGEYIIKEKKLAKGWNLVTIRPPFINKQLSDYQGDCAVDKMYLFNAQDQSWIKSNGLFSTNNLGYGFAIKVSNDCTLGKDVASETGPPALPQ